MAHSKHIMHSYTRTIRAHTDAGSGGYVECADEECVDHIDGEERSGLTFGHQIGHDTLHEKEAEQHSHHQVDLVPRVRRKKHREEADKYDDYHRDHQVAVIVAFTQNY